MEHPYAFMVAPQTQLSWGELQEIGALLPMEEFFSDENEYEYSGNFILTDTEEEWDAAIQSMCCGIFHQMVELSSGRKIYFAFDYGH